MCSRITWLKEGDATTKFFHIKANARRRKKIISNLIKQDGTYACSHDEKAQELFAHFNQIMGKKESRLCTVNWSKMNLSQVDVSAIDAAFTEEEVLAAIMDQPKDRAPGPDGFTGKFYKTCWAVIKADLMAAMCLQPKHRPLGENELGQHHPVTKN